MGSQRAAEFANLVREGDLTLDAALTDHLQHNTFPPIHLVFLPAAKKALRFVNANEFEEVVELPNGKKLTAGEVVEQMHLASFVGIEVPEGETTITPPAEDNETLARKLLADLAEDLLEHCWQLGTEEQRLEMFHILSHAVISAEASAGCTDHNHHMPMIGEAMTLIAIKIPDLLTAAGRALGAEQVLAAERGERTAEDAVSAANGIDEVITTLRERGAQILLELTKEFGGGE